MPKSVPLVRIVLCSPADVQLERRAVARIVDETNRLVAKHLGVRLELWRWETDAFPTFHVDGPQGALDSLMGIEDADIVVGVFWRRFGTPTVDSPSGTVHELQNAIGAWRNFESPHLMVYFNRSPYSPNSREETDQWGAVLDFKARVPPDGLWWEYDGAEEFSNTFREHLNRFLLTNFGSSAQSGSYDARFAVPSFRDSIARTTLESLIDEAVVTNPVIVLAGISGSGKTYAAARFLSATARFRKRPHWHDPDSGETLDSLLLALAPGHFTTAKGAVARCRELVSALKRDGGVLVIDNFHIVDQATYATLLDQAFKAGPPACLLVLSQSFVEPEGTAEPPIHVRIGGFSNQEASAYLQKHEVLGIPPDLVDDLISKTDGLPFAISLFAVQISLYGWDPRELLEGSIARTERIRKWFDNIVSAIGDDAHELLKSLSVCTGPFNMGVVSLLGRRAEASNAPILFGQLQKNLLVQRYSDSWWRIHELVALICRSELQIEEHEQIHAILGEHYLRRVERTLRGRSHVDEWKVRACREFLMAGPEVKHGKDVLMSLAAPAKIEGQYDLFIELSSPLVGRQSGAYLWIDYHHAHCAFILGAESYCFDVVQPLLMGKLEPSLRLAVTRLTAESLAALGDPENAVSLLSDAIATFIPSDSRAATVFAHAKSVMTELLIRRGDLTQASTLVEALIQDAQRTENLRGGAIALMRKAMILIAQNRHKDARPLIFTARDLFNECGDMRARAWSFTLQAELELLVEDENAAIDPLRQSETIASAIGQAGAEYRDQLRKVRTLSTQKGIVEIVERELSRVTIARERTMSRLTRVRS